MRTHIRLQHGRTTNCDAISDRDKQLGEGGEILAQHVCRSRLAIQRANHDEPMRRKAYSLREGHGGFGCGDHAMRVIRAWGGMVPSDLDAGAPVDQQ